MRTRLGAGPPGELGSAAPLSPEQLERVAALAEACLRVDGGRLKLEPAVLASRPGRLTEDFFWSVGDDLVGFVGIYQFGGSVAEVIGMVHPAWRRRGIFARLLAAALGELKGRGHDRALLIVHRGFEAGAALAAQLGARLEHSEHRMVQDASPPPLAPGEGVALRRATTDDVDFVHACLAAAFGVEEDLERGLDESMQVIEDGGKRVGVMRVDRDSPAEASIYGFAVLPEHQGRGIGRKALVKATSQLRSEGAESIRLEVSVENDHALRLYERCGFERVGTEDYFEISLRDSSPPI